MELDAGGTRSCTAAGGRKTKQGACWSPNSCPTHLQSHAEQANERNGCYSCLGDAGRREEGGDDCAGEVNMDGHKQLARKPAGSISAKRSWQQQCRCRQWQSPRPTTGPDQ